jgi:hypothetical protein
VPITSAVKHDLGKPQFHLIYPPTLLAEARLLTAGTLKYGPDNHLEPLAWTRRLDSALRHLVSWAQGEDIDFASGENHLICARAQLGLLYRHQCTSTGNDDRIA